MTKDLSKPVAPDFNDLQEPALRTAARKVQNDREALSRLVHLACNHIKAVPSDAPKFCAIIEEIRAAMKGVPPEYETDVQYVDLDGLGAVDANGKPVPDFENRRSLPEDSFGGTAYINPTQQQ